jgi:hypothetical protein
VTRLRKKRLLILAGRAINHKQYYSQYCQLIKEGLVDWNIGFASLTRKGQVELNTMLRVDKWYKTSAMNWRD